MSAFGGKSGHDADARQCPLMTQSGQEGGGQTARNLYAARGRVRYRVATKHIVSLENRPSFFILKKGGCCAKVRKTRDAGLPDFARLSAAPDPLGNQHEEQRTHHH
jgi:hypothetical protein